MVAVYGLTSFSTTSPDLALQMPSTPLSFTSSASISIPIASLTPPNLREFIFIVVSDSKLLALLRYDIALLQSRLARLL